MATYTGLETRIVFEDGNATDFTSNAMVSEYQILCVLDPNSTAEYRVNIRTPDGDIVPSEIRFSKAFTDVEEGQLVFNITLSSNFSYFVTRSDLVVDDTTKIWVAPVLVQP